MKKVTAIIVAGGSGKRMGMSIKKQYILLQEKEVLTHTLEVFNKSNCIDEIIVVVSEDEIQKVQQEIIEKYKLHKVAKVVAGGAERQDSVYQGLLAVDEHTEYVMIHDGARPFIKEETLQQALKVTMEQEASIVAVPVKDTIKMSRVGSQEVESTPQRERLWSVQTPQSFKKSLLLEAYKYAKAHNLKVTDDSMLVEAYGHPVYIVDGDYTNIKITTPEDLLLGEAILRGER